MLTCFNLINIVLFETVIKGTIMGTLDQLMNLFKAIVRVNNMYLKEVGAKFGISPAEGKILLFLANNPSMDTAQEIAQGRLMPKGIVSRGVESLVSSGYLIRNTDSGDRRRIHLNLTEKSEPIVLALRERMRMMREAIFSGFSEEDEKVLDMQLTRLWENAMEAGKNE